MQIWRTNLESIAFLSTSKSLLRLFAGGVRKSSPDRRGLLRLASTHVSARMSLDKEKPEATYRDTLTSCRKKSRRQPPYASTSFASYDFVNAPIRLRQPT